jgi:predicted GNAT superfamily acetyltransferase
MAADDIASVECGTDLHVSGIGGLADETAQAVLTAEAAAHASGVQIREITELNDLDSVYRLYDRIWRPDPQNPPVTTELLRALTKAGNYVAGAFESASAGTPDRSQLVGACVGFFGAPAGQVMHSHVAGVAPAALGRSVGFALKLHQRAWALQRGVQEITWTFDPLVSRNAYFNLVKLAAGAEEYLPNFYGGMNDAINGEDDSDRLLIRWELGAPQVVAACGRRSSAADVRAELLQGAVIGLASSADGRPSVGTVTGQTVLAAVPADIQALRSADPGCAVEWRAALRAVLAPLLADGARIAGFDKSGWYVVTRSTGGTPAGRPGVGTGATSREHRS